MSFALLGILQSQAAGGAAGTLEHLATVTNISQPVQFTNIPQDYAYLQIIRHKVSIYGSRYKFNGDGNANYDWIQFYSESNSRGKQGAQNKNWIQLGEPLGNTDGGVEVIEIYNYADVNKITTTNWMQFSKDNSRISWGGGHYKVQSAVTSIQFEESFVTSSRMELYGIRA